MSYNGCTNRETWLVKLYFEEDFYEYVTSDFTNFNPETDDIHKLADLYKDYVVNNQLEEELNNLSPFLSDFIDLEGAVDWYDLANTVYDDIMEEFENSNDDDF